MILTVCDFEVYCTVFNQKFKPHLFTDELKIITSAVMTECQYDVHTISNGSNTENSDNNTERVNPLLGRA